MKCESDYCFNDSTKVVYAVILSKPSRHISVNLCEDCYNLVYHTLTRLILEGKKSEYNATVAQLGRARV